MKTSRITATIFLILGCLTGLAACGGNTPEDTPSPEQTTVTEESCPGEDCPVPLPESPEEDTKRKEEKQAPERKPVCPRLPSDRVRRQRKLFPPVRPIPEPLPEPTL